MSVFRKLKRAARGEIKPTTAALETLRRTRVALSRSSDMRSLADIGSRPARLNESYSQLNGAELLTHFRQRSHPQFFAGFRERMVTSTFAARFGQATRDVIDRATRICDEHRWPLLGFGEIDFGREIEWRRDPVSGFVSPLTYHRDVQLVRDDGSDVRVLWELNRLAHLITLGQAYAVTRDEKFTNEFLSHLRSWAEQNPYGLGANWHCAMEVALRAMNLLAAFELFRESPLMTEQSLAHLLALLDRHGTYIRNNLEFSYIATSNHYFSDVVGLLWLAVMLPELREAAEWRQFGYREMLCEIDKQVLPDGADFESSTGYHRFILELLLYSFLLCRFNDIEISERYSQKVRMMLEYVRGYLRPDGTAPLIGDSDGGQVMPMCMRASDDHAFLLPIGALVFKDSSFKKSSDPPEELLWLFGENGLLESESLAESSELPGSISFASAGLHIQRHRDMYLGFNTSHAGINGRGSHGHNDALSIEVAACGRTFIVDPGTFVYTADLASRHKFRSTAYHSTVEIDGEEQNTTNINMPFVIGDEAQPTLLFWETGEEFDRVSAEHYGYRRFPDPVTHRRTISFNKAERTWLIDDEFVSDGEHSLAIRFHFDAGLRVDAGEDSVTAFDAETGAKLQIHAVTLKSKPVLETQATSRDYGEQRPSVSVVWNVSGKPEKLSWMITAHCPDNR
jgi:heparinase II/III-like protein